MALDRDPHSMSSQSLSKAAGDPNHPMHMHAKIELKRRKGDMDEGGMKRIATTQSNKADRMASGGKKGLETFKKKVNEVSSKTLSNYMRKSAADAGNASVFDVRRQDKRIGGQKRADDKLRKMQGKGSAAKVAATEDVNEAATPAMKKAADELNSYAKKHGGIDKTDFMKTAKMLSTGKAGMSLIKFVDGQDTDVYEKILTVMAKHMGKQTIEKMFKVKVREEVEQIDELTAAEKKLVNQMYDKKGNLTPMGKKVMNHGKKPGDKGYVENTNEEVESVNELSKDTMQSYWDKTKGDDAFSGSRKANNRLKGAINVTTKLDKLKKMVKR